MTDPATIITCGCSKAFMLGSALGFTFGLICAITVLGFAALNANRQDDPRD